MQDVARRFGSTVRTIELWMADEDVAFPRPKLIRRRRYFSAYAIEEWERRFSDQLSPREQAA
jgi:hypothetical protein